MSKELMISITIPAEYVREGAEDVCLDMPILYAIRVADIIRDACNVGKAGLRIATKR